MKKGFLASTVLAGALLFSTVACGKSTKYSVSIDNKDAMGAAWLSDDPSRTLELTIKKNDVEQNATKAIQDGELTFTVADNNVVRVQGRTVSPVGEGTTTVTAKYGDATDSVTVTITKTDTHGKSATDPLSVAEAVAICEETGTEETTINYYIAGVVSNVGSPYDPNYGNITFDIVDKNAAAGAKALKCYRVVPVEDATFDVTKISAGSEVLMCGHLVNYNGNTPEMPKNSVILSATEGTQGGIVTATVAQALAAAQALGDNATSNDKYEVTGYITAVDVGNGFYMSDTKGAVEPSKDQFLVYYGSASMPADATVNAKVKVTDHLKHYVSTSTAGKYAYETAGNSGPEKFELIEKGDDPTPVVTIKATVAEAKAVINALEDGATTTDVYEVTGYVTAKQDKATYTTYDYWLGETAESAKEDSIQVFRGLASGDYDKMAVGDKVVVTGNLQKFVKNETVTPEIKNSTWVKDGEVPPTPAPEPTDPLAAPVTFDFTGVEKGSELTGDALVAVLKTAAGDAASHVSGASASKVYAGNGNGGAYENQGGFIKFGTGSANGELTISVDGLVNKVEISCHDWYKKSDAYPTNNNTVAVNGGEAVLAPYNAEGTPETLTFDLSEAKGAISIVAAKRIFCFSITLSYVAA